MKKILIVLLVLSFGGIVNAQGFKIGVAGDLAKPTGDWADVTGSSGWGVHAYGVFDLMVLTITARAGYMDFGEYTYELLGNEFTAHTKAIPIMAGLRWKFGLPVGPSVYVGAEAGVHNFTVDVDAPGLGNTIVAVSESETKFSLSPSVGVELGPLDLAVYYMYIKDFSYFGARVGFGFGI
jgi:hypothetical protein